jgi:hypothetical protein
MTKEGQSGPISETNVRSVTEIHISLSRRSITLGSEGEPLATITFSPSGLLFETPVPALPSEVQPPEGAPTSALLPEGQASPGAEEKKEGMLILSGRLKSTPKEGRQDRSGKPTAYAKLAAHADEHEQAHMYLATFHGGTRQIALGLSREDPLTVEGYPHASEDPERSDTFSVIKILNYPGKPNTPER